MLRSVAVEREESLGIIKRIQNEINDSVEANRLRTRLQPIIAKVETPAPSADSTQRTNWQAQS